MIKSTFKKVVTRIRNPKVATAVVSGILMILVNTGIISVHMSNTILAGFNTILGILVGLGVFSNPDSHVEQPSPSPVAEPVAPVQPTEPQQPVKETK